MASSEFNSYPVESREEMDTLVKRNRETGWPDLPPKKRGFAHHYVLEYNHRESAEEVGYNASNGIKMLRDPLVAAYIEYLQELQLTSNIITKEFINTNYMKLFEMATGQVDIMMILPDGSQVERKKTMVGEATNILKEMSKSIEYEKGNNTKNAPVSISINFDNLTGSDEAPVMVIDANIIDQEDS